MVEHSRSRAAVKLLFWTAASVILVVIVARAYSSGQMAAWFYYTAATEGYAINADTFRDASKERPAVLRITQASRIDGLLAVPVKKGDRLPANCNGIIDAEILKKGKRAVLAGDTLKVLVPSQIQESKGFKFKDTFKHKGIETYPWGAVWNVVMVLALGLSLGYMAEGFTDVLGVKLQKIRHFEGH